MGTDAHLDELTGLANRLRDAGTQMESVPAAPSAPQVGASTQAVAGALAMLASSAAGVSEGMVAIGDAVQSGRDLYQETDDTNAEDLNNSGPR